jgi:hypothetical protein
MKWLTDLGLLTSVVTVHGLHSRQFVQEILNYSFLHWSRYYFFQVAPQLYSQSWVDPVSDPLLLRKCGSTGNRTWDLWICSQELWPLDHSCGNPLRWPRDTLCLQKLALNSLTSCGCSVGIVVSWTKATEFVYLMLNYVISLGCR